MNEEKKFVYNYREYTSKHLTVAELDDLFAPLKTKEGGKFVWIAKAAYMVVVCFYILARNSLMKLELQIKRQNYEQEKTHETGAILEADNLDQVLEDDLEG